MTHELAEYLTPFFLSSKKMYTRGRRDKMHTHLKSVKYSSRKRIFVEAYSVGPILIGTITEDGGASCVAEHWHLN